MQVQLNLWKIKNYKKKRYFEHKWKQTINRIIRNEATENFIDYQLQEKYE